LRLRRIRNITGADYRNGRAYGNFGAKGHQPFVQKPILIDLNLNRTFLGFDGGNDIAPLHRIARCHQLFDQGSVLHICAQ
jgi:hypothetical protein